MQRQAYAIVTQPHCVTPPAMPEPLNSRDTGAKEFPILQGLSDRLLRIEELFAPSTLRDIPLTEGQRV